MLKLEDDSLFGKYKLFIWLLMSFQAGYINVGGFIIFGNFVSHVTGTSSQIGMGVAGSNWEQILTFLTILISFISGAAFAGHFIGRKLIEKSKPRYILVTGVKVFIFFLILMVSEYYFIKSTYELKLFLVLLLSLACGMQNATCSLATNGFLKPTHMTGLSTDIGINLSKMSGYPKNSEEYLEERKKNRIRFGILGSFISGGSIAFFIFSTSGHYGFFFPFVSSLCFLFTSIISEKNQEKHIRKLKFAHSSILGVFLTTIIFGFINFINS